MDQEVFEKKRDGVLIDLRVSPNSGSFEIVGLNPWRKELEVKVSSKARKGKANRELLEEMGSVIGKDLELVSGAKSRRKKLFVEGSSIEELENVLELKG